MKRINNKGFTLIEMIAAVTILGIITVVAFSTINGMQNMYKTAKYETYEGAVVAASKLYLDANEEVLFGENSADACTVIPYSELESKGLISKITEKGVMCTGEVLVQRDSKKRNFTYLPHVYCYRENEVGTGKYVYNNYPNVDKLECDNPDLYLSGDAGKEMADAAGDEEAPTITVSNKITYIASERKRCTTITINDNYSLTESVMELKYQWINKDNGNTISSSKTDGTADGVLKVYRSSQTTASHEICISDTASGNIELVVEPVKVKDFKGNATTTSSSGSFSIESTPPVIKDIVARHTLTNTLTFTVSDNTDVQSYAVTTSSKAPTESEWKSISDSKTVQKVSTANYKVTESLKTGTYYIYAMDISGNISSKSVKVFIMKAPTLTLRYYNGTKGTSYYYSVGKDEWMDTKKGDSLRLTVATEPNDIKLKEMYVSVNGGEWTTFKQSSIFDSGATKSDFNANGYLRKEQQSHIKVKYVDEFGEESPVTEFVVKIDKTPPTCSVSPNFRNYVHGDQIEKIWVPTSQLINNNGIPAIDVFCVDGQSGCKIQYKRLNFEYTGQTLEYSVEDYAGNTTKCNEVSVPKVDLEPPFTPNVSYMTNGAYQCNNQSVFSTDPITCNLTCSRNAADYFVHFSAIDMGTGVQRLERELSLDGRKLIIYLYDNMGNKSQPLTLTGSSCNFKKFVG